MKTVGLLACSIVIAFGATAASASDEGKALYASKCAVCHGQDGVAKKSGEPSKAFGSAEFKASATAASIAAVVHDGKGKMKPVKNVTEEQAKQIAAYILTMGAAK